MDNVKNYFTMNNDFVLADLQSVRDDRRQCRVQAATRLWERGEGERGKEKEKEAGSKEKVIIFCLKEHTSSTGFRVFWNNLIVFEGHVRCQKGCHHHSESIPCVPFLFIIQLPPKTCGSEEGGEWNHGWIWPCKVFKFKIWPCKVLKF